MTSSTSSPPRPGDHWYRVPVEHRLLGLDKRSFPIAFVVIALWLLLHFGIPQLNDAISTDDQTAAGDRMLVTDKLAITPAAGWNVELGLRTTATVSSSSQIEQIYLTKGGVQLTVQADDFDGDGTELLAQIDRVAEATNPGTFKSASRRTVTTTSGITGVSETVKGATATGEVIALVDDGKGIEIQVGGPTDQMATLASEIHHMVTSLGPITTAGEGA